MRGVKLFAIIAFSFLVTSCKKTYTCHCIPNTPLPTGYGDPFPEFPVKVINSQRALKKCNDFVEESKWAASCSVK